MNWKKPLIALTIICIFVFLPVGCNRADTKPAVATVSTSAPGTDAGNSKDKNNPDGGAGLSDNETRLFRPPDNGTGLMPPGGGFGQGPARPDLDWAAAAATLGITEDALREAVGDLSAGIPDFAAIAAKLGITEQQLMEALGFNGGGGLPGERPQGQPPRGAGEPP